MKIAYLIAVHRNPILLKRAIAVLSTEDSAVFIHVDRKTDIQAFKDVSGDNVFKSKERIPVFWGEFSQVVATRLLLKQALDCPEGYEYFVFLQGSDYPLRSGRYIQRFLDDNRDAEFMNLVKMPTPGYPFSKINKLRYPSDRPLQKFASRVLGKFGLARRDYRKYLPGIEAYAGHACWTLSRAACSFLLDFAVSHPHFDAFFQNTFTADEVYFHTILGNSPFFHRVKRGLMYVDWVDPRHPRMLNDEHVRFFAASDEVRVSDEWGSGEVLFARKFSDERLDIVDRIDEMTRQKERTQSAKAARSGT